jgi:FkbM family methyltransferase
VSLALLSRSFVYLCEHPAPQVTERARAGRLGRGKPLSRPYTVHGQRPPRVAGRIESSVLAALAAREHRADALRSALTLMSDTAQPSRSPARLAYRFFNRPYYWFRPAQLFGRLRARPNADGSPKLLRTAWGSHLYCWPDALGRAVARTGVYDLTVAETLARLADSGETAVDAGANVGLMSDLLAHAVGPTGRVISFEPHPLIFETLGRNVEHWRAVERIAVIEPRQSAVSSSSGLLPLTIDPDTFAYNKGTASLEPRASASSTDVRTARLDDELDGPIGVLKLDVEMHELQALQGATSLLSGKLVRDIVFEEHEPPPTPVTALLESYGYAILGIRQGLTGPIVSTPMDAHRRALWDPPALLATSDLARARRRLKARGWRSLRRRLGSRAV